MSLNKEINCNFSHAYEKYIALNYWTYLLKLWEMKIYSVLGIQRKDFPSPKKSYTADRQALLLNQICKIKSQFRSTEVCVQRSVTLKELGIKIFSVKWTDPYFPIMVWDCVCSVIGASNWKEPDSRTQI